MLKCAHCVITVSTVVQYSTLQQDSAEYSVVDWPMARWTQRSVEYISEQFTTILSRMAMGASQSLTLMEP